MSRKGRVSVRLKPQAGFTTLAGVVCYIVNFIVGWILFSSSRNVCKQSRVPVYLMNMSSKNRFEKLKHQENDASKPSPPL